jgi:hypothetical protein
MKMQQRYKAIARCDGRYDVVELSTGRAVDTRETRQEANGAAQDRNRSVAYLKGELK